MENVNGEEDDEGVDQGIFCLCNKFQGDGFEFLSQYEGMIHYVDEGFEKFFSFSKTNQTR